MYRKWALKLLKFIGWLIIGSVFLVLIVVLALNTGPAQRWLTNKVDDQLSEMLQTDLGIGHIGIGIPKMLSIEEVYLNTPDGDELARIGYLGININMWALIDQEVEISSISLQDVYGNVVITDSMSNIQFLLDAFTTQDTVVQVDKPASDATASPWLVNLNNTQLDLGAIDIYYQDDPGGLSLDVVLAKGKLITDTVDLTKQHYLIDELSLSKADVTVRLTTPSVEQLPDTTVSAALIAGCKNLKLEEVDFNLLMDEMEVKTTLPSLQVDDFRTTLDENIVAIAKAIQLKDAQVGYDVSAVPPTNYGLDPNHIFVTETNLDLQDFHYQGDSIRLAINAFSTQEQSGLAVDDFTTKFLFHPTFIALNDLVLNTPQTELEVANLYYALPETDTDLLKDVQANAQGSLAIADLLLLVPDLRNTAVLANNASSHLSFHTMVETIDERLVFDRLDLDGPGMLLRSRGQVRDPLDMERLSGSFFLEELSFHPKDIIPLIPQGTLPAYIEWPETVAAVGEVVYRNQQLELNLSAREDRVQQERWTHVAVSGTAKRPLDFPNSLLNLKLDSLQLTRPSILAYLPPNTLPNGYQLPTYVQASGRVNGPVNDLNVALRFSLPGKKTFANLNGNVKEVMDPEKLYLDLSIEQLDIRKSDVVALLPDSLLPAELNLPDLSIQKAKVKGSLDDLSFNVPVNTTNGNWDIKGKYDPQDLQADVQITGIRAADFFVGAIRDTLLSLKLEPLNISATINGQLEPQLSATIAANVNEQGRGQLLKLDGILKDSIYQADFSFDHPYFSGQGFASYRLEDTTAIVDTDLTIEKIDLGHWGLSDRPLVASGKVAAFSNGLDPNDLEAHFLLDNLILRGDGATSFVDSLRLDATFDNGNNLATISGDVLEGELSGKFDPIAIVGELSSFVASYLREEPFPKEAVVNGNNLNLILKVKNPRPLTSGLIAGLNDLSPLSLSLTYRDRAPELKLSLEAEQISYTGLSLSGMQVTAEGTEKQLTFSTEWQNVAYGEDVQLGRTQISGQSRLGGIDVALQVFAKDSIRHRLALALQERDSQQVVILEEEQIINFEAWKIPENNLLSLSKEGINTRNWKLAQGSSYVQISETDTEGLAIEFQRINLEKLSRIINSEEELLGGLLDGTLYLDQLMTNLGIRADVAVEDLAYYQQPMGDLNANVTSEDNLNFDLEILLEGAGNKLEAGGQYRDGGVLDMNLRLDKLQMASIEPFALGYLQQTEGYLTGNFDIGGTVTEPTIDGRIDFKEVALAINLLGSRYRINEQSIRFNTKEINLNNFTLLDDNGNKATMDGAVLLESVNDIRFDLTASTRDFLAIDSEAKDNDLFYGYLRVDADVVISGDMEEPRLLVTASPTGDSELTYAYSAATQASLQTTQGVVTFAETYEWDEINKTGERDTLTGGSRGAYIETNLSIEDNLLIRVIVDPITQQEFSGRGVGDITFIQYPTGQQQMTGQVEMKSGRYDMVLEGLQRYAFDLEEGSRVYFTGNPTNPQLDLQISNTVKTSPLPLVQFFQPDASTTGLRKRQTFKVRLDLKGDMQGMDIAADILYPDDIYGNSDISSVNDALSSLRQNQSRVYTTAITLMTFKNFFFTLTDGNGNDPQQGVVNGVAGAVGDALSNLVNNQLGFVDVNLGVENYETSSGEQNYNLRLSLQKSFLDDRLVVSVDGVTNTAADAGTGEAQTYLDNVSVAYLLDEEGNLRIKVFNDRDRNVFVGGNVLRFGGRLVFSKNFDHFFWQKN